LGEREDHEDDRYARMIVHYKSGSPIAEAYRNIRTNLKLKPDQKTIMITSSGPREGKSTVLVNLGLAFAQKGMKTCLVSSDLRRPVIGKTFGVRRDPGFNEAVSGAIKLDDALKNITDIMLGEMSLEEVVLSPGIDNIWLLTSGHMVSNPAELLESDAFLKTLEELKKKFDIVIFDSPPVLTITDASLITPKVDTVILVYEIGRTARHALLRAKNQLELIGANISGVILNHISARTETTDSYPYYARYKYRYCYTESDKTNKVGKS